MRKLIPLIILLLYCKVAISVCPTGWTAQGSSCYYFSSVDSNKLPWHDASAICEFSGGNLVVIQDEIENNFLYDRLKNSDGVVESGIWIGLHDLAEEDQWQWVDGSGGPDSYTNWEPGQPDNWGGSTDGTEDCAEFYGGFIGTWNDQSCYYNRFFICERDVNADLSTNCNEIESWQEYNNKCYKYFEEPLPWIAASKACTAAGGDLVSITSQTEQDYVSTNANNKNRNLWTGLSSVNHQDNSLYWSNGHDDYIEGSSFNNWLTGQPVLDSQSSNCVEVQPSATLNGPWNVDRCGNAKSYLCETVFTGTCALGWRLYKGKCYFIAENSDLFLNWPEANKYCTTVGGSMLIIDGNEEAEYIQSKLPRLQDAGSNGLWLGVSDTETDGVFKWVDGRLDDDVTYKKWATNQPRTRDGAWDCGQIYTGASSGVWETADCYAKQSFICEIDAGVPVKPIDPTADIHKGCDPDWVYYNGYCYYIEYSSPKAWQEAEDSCKLMGSHLASVLDGNENAFVSGLASESCWIGLNDMITPDRWQWSDKSPYNYDDFVDGEPNNSGDCVYFWAGQNYRWDDTPCTQQFSYVCKKQHQECNQQLGMEDFTIPDNQITASSIYNEEFQPYFGRLNMQAASGSRGCWSPATNTNEYLQIKLNGKQTLSGVTTQGRPADSQQYVKSFYVAVSDDGQTFEEIQSPDGTRKVFTANFDHLTPITNYLPNAITTSYVRIYPLEFYGYPSMRAELVGCSATGGDIPSVPTETECWSVGADDRLDCGYYGITDQECVSKGCCWDETQLEGVPWCFYKKGQYDPRCGVGFIYDSLGGAFCYHFNEYIYRSWNNARKYCQDLNGELLSIHSRAEDSWVTAHISNKYLTHSFWLGANDMEEGLGWRWSDGSPFQYFNWANGEPNDSAPSEDCAELYIESAQWNDVYCSNELAVACKKLANNADAGLDTDQNYMYDICEGDTMELVCPLGTFIVIHHASYGRSSSTKCAEGGAEVPPGGCQAENVLDIVSAQCNHKEKCPLRASNEIFGDPCYETYKYLNVIFSCQFEDCYQQLGVENGSISDSQISESGYIDANHKGSQGRLNGPMSWSTNEQSGAYVQVDFGSNLLITGVITQGSNDQSRWVTKFNVGFSDDTENPNFNLYQDYDGLVVEFMENSDQQTTVRSIFAESVLANAIRIYPLEWNVGIGMRFDVTGCDATDQADCRDTFDNFVNSGEAEGVTKTVHCKGGCPTYTLPTVYGTDVYTGSSEICSSAVHAGYLNTANGGPVTMIHKPGQNSYVGSDRHHVVSHNYPFYDSSFSFTGNRLSCESEWVPYAERCFWISSDPLTWDEAQISCRAKGGDLVSIYDSADQDFVHQLIQKTTFGEAWIGLNDLRTYNEYEWSDSYVVTYTNWEPNEPNNYQESAERCVEMYKGSGRWNDQLCTDVQDYVCSKLKDYYSKEDVEPHQPPEGCDQGWIASGASCYLLDRTRRLEAESAAFCSERGGYNLQIHDNLEQSFIHTILGSEDARWWLGMKAHQDESYTTWEWDDNTPVVYSNWGYGQPNVEAGSCALFFGGVVGLGMWYSSDCDQHQSYSLCEKQRVGFTPPPETVPPPLNGCLGGWVSPSEDDEYCYKVFKASPDQEDPSSMRQTWHNAREQCRGYTSELVSIHSKTEETFLLSQLLKEDAHSMPVWIGLNRQGLISWEWSDNSITNFANWQSGYPIDSNDNQCVTFVYDSEKGTGQWQNRNCFEKHDFICKHDRYNIQVDPTGELPTGAPNPACGSESDGVWLQYNNLCYLFNDFNETSHHGANRVCNALGGELVSIHSVDEQAFITGQLKKVTNLDKFWIGLKEQGVIGGVYAWTDQTVLDYVYWNPGEPNDSGGVEQCVVAYKGTGKWNDANCGLEIAGYICKKYLGNPPIVPTLPTPVLGGCGSGWFIYGNYCYKLYGNRHNCNATLNTPECMATWQDAQQNCKEDASNLVTIHDKYENAFLAAHLLHSVHDTWIGLSDLQWWKKYTWANGEEVLYVNWKDGEPNKGEIDDENHREECVEMYKGNTILGRWNDNNCYNMKPYMCMKNQDPSIPIGSEINSNRNCGGDWSEFEIADGNYVCFLIIKELKSFNDARDGCRQIGGELASIQGEHEQMFLTSLVKSSSAWIGLQLSMTTYEWLWIDGWPVWLTNWGEGMPGNDFSKGCVINKDAAVGTEWMTVSCSDKYYSVCKKSSQSVPTSPPAVEGHCRDPSWRVYGGFCYFYNLPRGSEEQDPGLTWAEAEDHCNREFGNLVSFAERAELEWLQTWYNNTEPVWIGMNENTNKGWAWTSGRPVTFTNWNVGEPNNYGPQGEDCVEMSGEDGMWNDIDCTRSFGYICRVPRIIDTDENGNPIHYTTPASIGGGSNNSNGGAIAGAIIGVIVLIAAIGGAFYFFRKSSPVAKITDGASGFVNKLYSSGDSQQPKDNKDTTIRFEPTTDSET